MSEVLPMELGRRLDDPAVSGRVAEFMAASEKDSVIGLSTAIASFTQCPDHQQAMILGAKAVNDGNGTGHLDIEFCCNRIRPVLAQIIPQVESEIRAAMGLPPMPAKELAQRIQDLLLFQPPVNGLD